MKNKSDDIAVATVLLWIIVALTFLFIAANCASINTAECTNDVEYYESHLIPDPNTEFAMETERVCLSEDLPFVKDIKENYPEGTIYRVWYGLQVINFWFKTETDCVVVCTLFQTEEDLEIALSEDFREALVEWQGSADCDFMDERLAESLAK